MSDIQKKPDAPPSIAPQADPEIPLDTRLLSEAVIELNISRKNVGIYPPGHIQITKSIDRAFEFLQKVFDIRPDMTLGVAKDTLLVGQDYLDRKNPVYRDFALSLNQQGIAAITFVRGLEKDELVRFHRILTTKPDGIAAAGGIRAVMEAAELQHIVARSIDYGDFVLTDEKEIHHTQQRGREKDGMGLWQDFVTHLSGGTLAKPGQEQGVSLKDAEQIDPLELARLLNERKLDTGATVQSYDRIISTYVRHSAEKKELTREQSETLRNLNNLLKNLNPDLRKQFLSVAFQRTADASPAVTEELMGGLTDAMVVEMLQQANAEGREISPTLTGLLNKLASVGDDGSSTQKVGAEYAGTHLPEATPEQMRTLFDREQYENYVSPEYAATLKHLSEQAPLIGTAATVTFPLAEAIESLREDKLDYQISRAMLAFIDEDIEDEDYGEFLKKIIDAIPELLKTENFGSLRDVLETLRLHSREKRSPGIRAIAGNALRMFNDPGFVVKVVDAFESCSRTNCSAGAGLLLALGSQVVPLLLEQYAHDDAVGGRRALFDLLCRFGNAAVQEAVTRLRDPRPYYVRNLLMLIRWGWDASVAPQVRPLLKHGSQKVRHEAVTTLLRFKDPAVLPELNKMIQSNDPDEASLAIKLAGQFRVVPALDALLSRLKKVIIFETDYLLNEEIIRALGEIGSPRAVPELEKLARASWSLLPSRAARMKAELFESLARYPPASIKGLIGIGERLGNERVVRACKKLKGSV